MATLNLRPAITSISAVLEDVSSQYSLTATERIVLGSIPVLAFAVVAPFIPRVSRKLGGGSAVGIALLTLAAGLIVRAFVPGALLAATFLCGASIMVMSVLVPQLIKEYGSSGWWAGAITLGFGLGAALGAGYVRPLVTSLGGALNLGLAVWCVPALLAASLVFLSKYSQRGNHESPPIATDVVRMRLSTTAAAVAAYFGVQAFLYFSLTAWMPAYLVSRGMSPSGAADMLAWFNIAGFLPTLMLPVLASKSRHWKAFPAGIGIALAAGIAWLLVAPESQLFYSIGWIGAAQSSAFCMAVLLILKRTTEPGLAGSLSALAQGSGFALAALGPAAIGLIHQLSGWTHAFLAMLAISVVLALVGAWSVTGPNIARLVKAPR
ncbi:MAG: MFS transporter [Arthrobacter sp.]|nr:MFS transporter [Arthrobacter sp.]